MLRRTCALLGLLPALTVALAACGEEEAAAPASGRVLEVDTAPEVRNLAVETLATGLERPTYVGAAPGDPRGLWVVEQTGRIVRMRASGRGPQRVVLDLSAEIRVGAEQGVLGLAFHPGFARDRRFYVDYTDTDGHTRVVEFRLGRDGRADRSSAREVLFVRQPEENHNGGALAFGPDGRLYVGMGDGGGAFDPRDNAQDPESRLGKVLAANVDGPGRPRWSVLLSGMRNPWRMWFDPAMNELWIGDVGQDEVEEVDRVPLELDEPPKNLGWPRFEGEREFTERKVGPGELVGPVASYSHDLGCSITGGSIYRGTAIPALSERYVFGDFCTGLLWSVRPVNGGAVRDPRREAVRVPQLTHIGTDAAGELVFSTADGKILRATAP